MKETMNYKGFTGSAELDLEAGSIRGKILFISDLITFQSDNAKDIKAEFEAAVDDYLETCEMLGREPMKPCSGTFNVRVGPERHQKLAIHAALNGVKINHLIKTSVDRFLADPSQKPVVHNHYHGAPQSEITKSLTYNTEDKVVHIRGAYVAGLQ